MIPAIVTGRGTTQVKGVTSSGEAYHLVVRLRGGDRSGHGDVAVRIRQSDAPVSIDGVPARKGDWVSIGPGSAIRIGDFTLRYTSLHTHTW